MWPGHSGSKKTLSVRIETRDFLEEGTRRETGYWIIIHRTKVRSKRPLLGSNKVYTGECPRTSRRLKRRGRKVYRVVGGKGSSSVSHLVLSRW